MLSVATIKISTKLKSVSVSGTFESVNLWCSNINAFECKKKGSQQCSRYIWNQRGTRAGFVVAAVFVCCSRVVCVSWETCGEGIHTHTHTRSTSGLMMMYSLDLLRSLLSSTQCQDSAVTQADTQRGCRAKEPTICSQSTASPPVPETVQHCSSRSKFAKTPLLCY